MAVAPCRAADGSCAAVGIASSSGTVNEKTLPTSGVLSTRKRAAHQPHEPE